MDTSVRAGGIVYMRVGIDSRTLELDAVHRGTITKGWATSAEAARLQLQLASARAHD